MAYQLQFFEKEKNDLESIRDDVKVVKESTDKVRKSMFARHGQLARQCAEISERLQVLERNICSGEITTILRS